MTQSKDIFNIRKEHLPTDYKMSEEANRVWLEGLNLNPSWADQLAGYMLVYTKQNLVWKYGDRPSFQFRVGQQLTKVRVVAPYKVITTASVVYLIEGIPAYVTHTMTYTMGATTADIENGGTQDLIPRLEDLSFVGLARTLSTLWREANKNLISIRI